MSDSINPPSSTDVPVPYETPVLERLGTFRELTLAGGGGNCDPSLVLGPETGNVGGDLGRCYE
jgi:hypothetical protein